MEISFKTKALQKVCSLAKEAVRGYGPKSGGKLMQRMNELKSFENLADVPKFPLPDAISWKVTARGSFPWI